MRRALRRLGASGVAAIVILAVVAQALPAAVASQTQQVTVTIEDDVFLPAEMTIPAGTTVTWVNAGRAGRSTTSPGVWDSGSLGAGERWSAVMATEGTFDYVSAHAPGSVQGRIVVRPAPADDDSRGTNPGFGGIGAVSLAGAGGGPSGTATALAVLLPQGGAGMSGEASLLQNAATTTLVVTLYGLPRNSVYAGHVRGGGCNGPSLFALQAIRPDATGTGSASTTINAPLDTTAWWIAYAAAEGPPVPGVTCGPVRASEPPPVPGVGDRCPTSESIALERCH